MFEPTNNVLRRVVDPQTGVSVRVQSTSDFDTLIVVVEFPDDRSVRFGISITTNTSTRGSGTLDCPNCDIGLLMAELKRLADFRNGTRDENSAFVRYILSGLSAIHRQWPITKGGRFYLRHKSSGDLQSRYDFDLTDEDARWMG